MIPATLTGLAVADALGMPFETRRFDDPFLQSWDGVTYLSSDYHKLGPGQWTDDTTMSCALASSLITCNRFDVHDVANRYLAWYESGDHRGMGKTTALALKNLQEGVSPNLSGIKRAEGNGTAMRAAPIGAFHRFDLGAAFDAAKEDARVTHCSKAAEDGSVAIALAVQYLAAGRPKMGLMGHLLTWVGQGGDIGRQLSVLFHAMTNRYSTIQGVQRSFGTSAHVVQTVPSALACFLTTESYLEAVQAAIRAGGDTDTTAAITGALAGTYYGLEGIPEHLVDQLEDSSVLRALDLQLTGLTQPS